jgi:hypothetical protein
VFDDAKRVQINLLSHKLEMARPKAGVGVEPVYTEFFVSEDNDRVIVLWQVMSSTTEEFTRVLRQLKDVQATMAPALIREESQELDRVVLSAVDEHGTSVSFLRRYKLDQFGEFDPEFRLPHRHITIIRPILKPLELQDLQYLRDLFQKKSGTVLQSTLSENDEFFAEFSANALQALISLHNIKLPAQILLKLLNEAKVHNQCIDTQSDDSDSELLAEQFAAVSTAEHKTVAGSSALKANDSQSSKSKVLTKDDSRPTQVASSNSQAASKQQQGGPRDKNVAKLRRLSAQVPDDEDAPLSSLLPANSANKAGGLSSPPPPSNAVSPKAAVPAADGFSPLPMSQSSETSATSPLNKLMLAAGLPEVSSSEVQKRQRSPSLQEPLSPTKVAKKGGATPITTRPPRITPKSRQPPTQSDIAKLQRPSPTIAAPTPTGQGDTTPESEGSNGDEQDSSGGTSSQESSEHEETAKPKPKQVPKKGKGRGGNR